jgi:hypothetical protein
MRIDGAKRTMMFGGSAKLDRRESLLVLGVCVSVLSYLGGLLYLVS